MSASTGGASRAMAGGRETVGRGEATTKWERTGKSSREEFAMDEEPAHTMRGPPNCQGKIVGDPEIVDCKDRDFHYLGPALRVNLDKHGLVRSLELVRVHGSKPNKNYIRDRRFLDSRSR